MVVNASIDVQQTRSERKFSARCELTQSRVRKRFLYRPLSATTKTASAATASDKAPRHASAERHPVFHS